MKLRLRTIRWRSSRRLFLVIAVGFALGPAPLRRTVAADVPAPAPSPVSPLPGKDDGIEIETREAEHTRRFLEDRVHRDPEDAPALDRLASTDLQLLRLTGDYAGLVRARVAAKASMDALPPSVNADGLAVMARVEFESHRFAEARDLARQMTGVAPGRADGFLILGDALLELGDIGGAQSAWHEAEQRGSGQTDREVRLARVALLGGKLD